MPPRAVENGGAAFIAGKPGIVAAMETSPAQDFGKGLANGPTLPRSHMPVDVLRQTHGLVEPADAFEERPAEDPGAEMSCPWRVPDRVVLAFLLAEVGAPEILGQGNAHFEVRPRDETFPLDVQLSL